MISPLYEINHYCFFLLFYPKLCLHFRKIKDSMKVHILAFGITKDIVGGSTFEFQIEEGSNVGQLKKHLQQQYPAFEDLASLAIAVNSEYASEELVIKAADEIVLIPPVSGG